jgi:hypothetical protein
MVERVFEQGDVRHPSGAGLPLRGGEALMDVELVLPRRAKAGR